MSTDMEKEKITEALNKAAVYGNNIDLNTFDDNNDVHAKSVESMSNPDKKTMEKVGMELNDAEDRSGTFLQVDNAPVEIKTKKDTPMVLMNTGDAAKKYPELVEKYWWKAVKADTDKYTAKTALEKENGYFVHLQKGVKIAAPVQSCMFMSHENQLQRVHNIIILEEGAELNLITGCASDPSLDKG